MEKKYEIFKFLLSNSGFKIIILTIIKFNNFGVLKIKELIYF